MQRLLHIAVADTTRPGRAAFRDLTEPTVPYVVHDEQRTLWNF